jgi:hypothetical protein
VPRVLLALGLVGVAAIGALIGLLSIGLGTGTTPGHAIAEAAGAHPFAVGSCFYGDGSAGGTALRPTACDGDRAVFVINAVVADGAACGQVADYARFGAAQRDVSAKVVYCVSLVLKQNSCVVLGREAPSRRVDCGSDPTASRVVRVVPSVNPPTACAGVPNADVWYFRGPSSGQIACLTRDAG